MLDEARLIFERMMGYANHLGLYAEEIGMSGERLGNFPQAFAHLASISAADNVDRALEQTVTRRRNAWCEVSSRCPTRTLPAGTRP